MPTPARYYSSNAAKTTLAASISSSATSLTLAAASNLPAQYPYTLILEKDTANEEVVEVTSLVGSAYQITRNIDSSGAKAHAFGANVEHGVSARDFTESRQHEVATTSIHGVTGDIVGTGGAQTLTSKTLTTPIIAGATISGAFTSTATITGGTITGATITGLSTPTNTSDAATKGYIDTQTVSAAASASSASVSASSAATSASSAATSASSALTSQTSAAASATSAATSAASSLTSQTSAATSATSAAASATAAATSATSAATSASSATTSASSASTSASSAATSASSALTSATSAASSATTAAASVATIATYASAASTSATSASTSATSAATSASSASASATTASNSAATATTSASQAATSASSAATSASSAAASETAAATSASSAATSASSAAASYDSFDDRYLGSKISAPSVDNDGNALLEGALYWDSTNKNMNVWNGTAWEVVTTSGDITAVNAGTGISGGGASGAVTISLNTSSVYVLPDQTGNGNKFLKTNGSTATWAPVAGALAQPTEPSSPDDGQIWIDTDGTAPTTVVTRWTEQPAAGTTVLTGNDDYSIPLAYSPGYEQVFLNGVLLSRSGGEYTATSGTSITLASATVAGDIVEVICPLQIATTDTYTQSAVNNAFQANTNNFTAGKNKIINGDFGVWQRGTTFSSITEGTFFADRYVFTSTAGGSTATASRQTFTPGASPVAGYEGSYFARLALTSGSGTTTVGMYQKIEDVRAFAGQTTTISFWAKADSARTLTIYSQQYFGTGGSSAVTTSTTVSLTTSWARYSYTVPLASISGKTIGTGSFLYISVEFGAGQASGSLTFDTWGWQVEAGSNATAFQTATGTIGGELSLCQRYYYLHANADAGIIGMGAMTGTNIVEVLVSFPTSMRATPTVVVATGSSYYRLDRTGASDDFNSFTGAYLSTNGADIYNNTEVSGTSGHAGSVRCINASSSLAFNAEL